MNPNDFSQHITLQISEQNRITEEHNRMIAEQNRIHSLNRRRKRNFSNTKSKRKETNMSWNNFSIFNALLYNLNPEEARKAKVLYFKNIIAGFKFFSQITPLLLLGSSAVYILMFFSSITVFPIFALLALLFLFIEFSISIMFFVLCRQIIKNVLEAWKEDLGDDYFIFKRKVESIKIEIPFLNIPII